MVFQGCVDFLDWDFSFVRPFFERRGPEHIAEYDSAVARLRTGVAAIEKPLAICFLGAGGIGKSTLINALVAGAGKVVPSGGIGPLTAQALSVEYGAESSIRVEYHGNAILNRLIFALERGHVSELKALAYPLTSREILRWIGTGETTDRESVEAALEDVERSRQRMEEFLKKAQLMVTGSQDGSADLVYLLDRLNEAGGRKPKGGTICNPDDQHRIERLSQALVISREKKDYFASESSCNGEFPTIIDDHAAGFLAPLIKKLTVHCNSELLKNGLILVDLPGVGVSGDVHKEVTREWVRERADAVILVVKQRGMDESVFDMLKETDFLKRLLHSVDDPSADPVMLGAAVVRVDEACNHNPDKIIALREEAIKRLKDQIKSSFTNSWSSETENVASAKRLTLDRLMQNIVIHAMGTEQYCLALKNSPYAFVKNTEDSGVPGFADELRRLAAARREDRTRSLLTEQDNLLEQIVSRLDFIQKEWQSDERASNDVALLREELRTFLSSRREEFRVRQGAFRNFLSETVPSEIRSVAKDARQNALKDFMHYFRRNLQNAHAKTLQATMKKEGSHSGKRTINLPEEFANCFDEHVAAVWGQSIIGKIRKGTKAYGDDCVRLVREVVEWAREQGARVSLQRVEALAELIRTDAKGLDTVGKETLNGLRERVRNRLTKAITAPIVRRCRQFVERQLNFGTGLRDRVLEQIQQMAEEVTDVACEKAIEILIENYEMVHADIRKAFKEHQDPLKQAEEALVSSTEQTLRRSDAQKRKAILGELDKVMERVPKNLES